MNKKANELFQRGLASEKQFEFESAKATYQEIAAHFGLTPVAFPAASRLEDMDDLIAEKRLYERIDINAKRVLSEIGINIADSPELLQILMDADAVDFDNSTAVFVPLKQEYVRDCLAQVPKKLACDPGLNAFGTGATPPFLKRPFEDQLRAANRGEFEEIVRVAADMADVVRIFSLPVATDRSISDYEAAQVMEKGFPGLKMTATKNMADPEVAFLKGKDHWLDGTSLITSLAPMRSMVKPFLRSVRTGNILLLLDLTIAGASGPQSPEALLTQIHSQVLFMMVLAQTLNPGVACVHGGIPGVVEAGGDLSYSSPHQPLINAAMARVNLWVAGYPSAQSGGSTSITEVNPEALSESELSRNTLRKYGVHILRHAMGALGSLNFFSLQKFVEDCERERRSERTFLDNQANKGVIPLYFPADDSALEGIREIAEKGNPKNADHTLRNVEAFMSWEKRINDAARKKLYYPQLNDTVIELIRRGDFTP
jgi:trimethylamine--corrinoid protein Co-methyltransferase